MLTPTNSNGPSHIEAFYASITRFARTGRRLTRTTNGVISTIGRLAVGKDVVTVSIVRSAGHIALHTGDIASLTNSAAGRT